jgi:hypothetical protein
MKIVHVLIDFYVSSLSRFTKSFPIVFVVVLIVITKCLDQCFYQCFGQCLDQYLDQCLDHQTSRILTTISEQSQLLSPSKLLALQRQTSLSVSQPRLSIATSPLHHGSSQGSSFDYSGELGNYNKVLPGGISVGTNTLILIF